MTKSDILNKYRNDITGCQKNFYDKPTLRNELKKDFNLNDKQISFENESVLINIDGEVIKLDLLIESQVVRFKMKQ